MSKGDQSLCTLADVVAGSHTKLDNENTNGTFPVGGCEILLLVVLQLLTFPSSILTGG